MLRVSCDLRAHDDTRGVYRLGEVLSVESVLIECTLHRANLTGRAGWYARRRRGGAPLSFQENAFDVVVDIVWSGEHERPLTLCERMCLEARARMSSIFFSPTDSPVETRARFPKKFQHPIENAF